MQKEKITLKEAISIGIGGMVGGSVFAVLGLAVSLGKGSTPFSFLIANLLKLESISTAGSVGFSLIFAIVNFIGFKLAKQISGNKAIPLLGFVMCLTTTEFLYKALNKKSPT